MLRIPEPPPTLWDILTTPCGLTVLFLAALIFAALLWNAKEDE
ncbi:hypothetical protein [Desulfocurvus sp. DL9XJH121]